MVMPKAATILLVDDSPDGIEVLNEILQNEYRVLFATSGPMGLAIAQAEKPDAILLDVTMPGMDGYQVCSELKANPDTRAIPVIFVTARDQGENEEMGFRIGGADYVTKPVRPVTVRVRVRNQLQLRRNDELILHQALYDGLTHLPNRSLTIDRLWYSIVHDQRGQQKTGLLFIDLDNFKKVNDSLGHDAGDQLLIEAAARLLNCVREMDTVGRLGGDEFVVVLPALKQARDAGLIAENILRNFASPLLLSGMEMVITVSIGIAICPDDGTDAKLLLSNADTAMYQSKRAGRNRYRLYNEAMNQGVRRHMQLEHQLHHALERGELILHYQPIVDVVTRAVLGAEALVRWVNPELGAVEPDEFIGLAEQVGVIENIGAFVLEQGCRQLGDLAGPAGQPLTLAVNVSPQQIRRGDLPSLVERILRDTGFAAARLELEITEGLLLDDLGHTKDALQALRELGVNLSVDDFGTGYSSLSYLRKYAFDTVKIDRTFIAEMARNPEDEELVTAAVAMAHGLGKKAIAEGVENEAQLALLAAKGCDRAQGTLFSRPLAWEAFADYLAGASN